MSLPRVLKNLTVLVIICLIIGGTTLLLARAEQPKAPKESVPNFQFTDLNGKQGYLYQYENQPVVLHFWATWCPPCVHEMPELLNRAEKMPNVVFLLISVDRQKENITRYMSRFPIPKNVVLIQDADDKITRDIFYVQMFPETLLLHADKTLQSHFNGPMPWNEF